MPYIEGGQSVAVHSVDVTAELAQAQQPSQKSGRRQTRKEKSQIAHTETSTPATTDTEQSEGAESRSARKKKSKAKSSPKNTAPEPMAAARTLPLLICSVGNPGSTYANTLHSAGHTVLNRLAAQLGAPTFQKDRSLGNGLVSRSGNAGGADSDWTLWQSTAYMNESGKGVRAAYMAWSKTLPPGEEGRLVIVHDELEKALGGVSLRTTQGASAKGHNGLKSIMAVMGATPFARIGVGIGRPVSRAPDDVARYVLSKMAPADKMKVEGAVDGIMAKLRELERG